MATASEYDAFISYSHRHDDALGPALQTSLERFAKPWYKLRALRTFIDKANLAASPELWASVEDGLESSRWFVLPASADAARASWVDREVRWWLDHRSDDQLLVVATSPGMAWVKEKQDWTAAAPVPSALRGAFTSEPFWIDLSNIQLDSRKPQIPADLIANVAAPIRAVPKDTLVGQHLREHRRTMRLAGSAVTVLAVLTVLAIVASLLAIGQRDNAIGQRNQVIYNNILTEALQLSATNPSLAAQLNLTAYRMHQNQTVRSRLLSTENALLANPLQGSAATVGTLAFSPDGQIMATGSYDGVIRLWTAGSATPWATIGQARSGTIDEIFSVAFSPDSHILAAGDAQGRVRIWKVMSSARPLYLGQVQASAVFSVVFSPDGHLLAAGGEDGEVRLWNVTDPAHPTAAGHLGSAGGGLIAVYSVAFSPDSRTLAVGNEPGAIRLWNVARPGHPVPLSQLLRGNVGSVRSVVFSPDGHSLVIGGDDRLLRRL